MPHCLSFPLLIHQSAIVHYLSFTVYYGPMFVISHCISFPIVSFLLLTIPIVCYPPLYVIHHCLSYPIVIHHYLSFIIVHIVSHPIFFVIPLFIHIFCYRPFMAFSIVHYSLCLPFHCLSFTIVFNPCYLSLPNCLSLPLYIPIVYHCPLSVVLHCLSVPLSVIPHIL